MAGRRQLIRFTVARAGGRVLRLLPDRIVGVIASGTARPGRVPLLPVPGRPDRRLLIGPANSAGQADQWARAVERERPRTTVVSMAVVRTSEGYGFAVDQAVPLAAYRWSRAWSRRQRDTVIAAFTHVLSESGRQLFGDTMGSTLRELRALRRAGVGVGLVFHGSDLRSPRRHAASSPWSPFHEPWSLTPTLESRAGENARLVRRLGAPAFVTTPDLLDDLPEGLWLPVVVDPTPWAVRVAPLTGARPVVAHAPSSSHLKGTALIEPVLEALHAEGIIEYRRIAGVPSARMPAEYAQVDIVLDQFRIGSYGVVAVEAMNAGRVVIARIEPRVRERIRQATGRELPVLDADPGTLESVLRAIAADPSAARAAAAAGPSFAAEVHGGAFSARVLSALLD